jgi:nucleotide-binding universal stress UspA family protein
MNAARTATPEHCCQAIIARAGSKGADLILIGSHGRQGIFAIVPGGETVGAMMQSKIPVLVHR